MLTFANPCTLLRWIRLPTCAVVKKKEKKENNEEGDPIYEYPMHPTPLDKIAHLCVSNQKKKTSKIEQRGGRSCL